jgi:hypothetical protein
MAEMVPIAGLWTITKRKAVYNGPKDGQTPIGLCLYPSTFRSGEFEFSAKFKKVDPDGCARVVLGRNPETEAYHSIGIGGYGSAYVSDVFNGRGWQLQRGAGSFEQLLVDKSYRVQVGADGQQATLIVNGVIVLKQVFPRPLPGNQVGIMTWGSGIVEFERIRIATKKPKVFVVMQFGDKYDRLYSETIRPVCRNGGYAAHRADDSRRPGIVMEDIIREIIQSDVVIAEITPRNGNVFYELGHAHALGKPTILIFQGKKIPFDIRARRIMFYRMTGAGIKKLRGDLKIALESVRAETE